MPPTRCSPSSLAWTLASALGVTVGAADLYAAEPEEASDDESAPSGEDVAVPEGSEPAEAGDGDKPKKKVGKRGKTSETSGKALPEAPRAPDRETGKAAIAIEKRKPWIKRWAPERNMLDLGASLGALFVSDRHGLFDAGEGPRPALRTAGFDFQFRAAFMPLSFLGIVVEGGPSANHSTSARANSTIGVFRVMALAQLPYRVTPTLALGGGFINSRSPEQILREFDGAFHWGGGLKAYINQWIAVRIDGRHIVTRGSTAENRAHYGELLFGVDVTLRMRRLVKARNIDRDNDGWLDRDDRCPTEPGDENGCAADRDGDNDGVIDRLDRCPTEYGDGARGCPVPDTDSDGILDAKDECHDRPETRNGFQDTDGCPDEAPAEIKKLTGVIGGITFDSGTATIRKSSRKSLDEVAETMKTHTGVRIEVVGHTDDQGQAATNSALSGQRAEAVEAYLVGEGIDADRIVTRGAGADEPIADNKTKAGRAANRRIEFRVLE
ncbi:MAG: OmpA family protein [Deltaproteobacteria bacterium]|nr:OmpA family protein [Nannocystaceae bacterium]